MSCFIHLSKFGVTLMLLLHFGTCGNNSIAQGVTEGFEPDREGNIRSEIFKDYTMEIRPAKTVVVDVLLHLMTVNDLNTKSQKFSTTGYFVMKWEDSRLKWNSTQHNGVDVLFSDETKVWTPPVVISNEIEVTQWGLVNIPRRIECIQEVEEAHTFYYRMMVSREWWAWTLDPGDHAPLRVSCPEVPRLFKCDYELTCEINKMTVISDEKVPVRINATGELEWQPPVLMETSCAMDVTYYPFDSQSCSIQMISWGYFLNELSLKARSIDVADYIENGEWTMENFYLERKEDIKDGNDVSKLKFTFRLRRRPLYYVLNAIVPAVLMSFLSPIVFVLPADAGEKVSYIITVFLAYAVLLTLISDQLPSAAKTPSAISIYLTIITVLGALSVLVTIKILEIYHRDDSKAIPAWLQKLTNVLDSLLCFSNGKVPPRNVITPSLIEGNPTKKIGQPVLACPRRTWKDIAITLDMFFFRAASVITILIAFSFILSLICHYYTHSSFDP